MPRANQHWVEELDFAIEEWTLDGVRLVEVLGRVHHIELAHQALSAAKGCATHPASPSGRGTQVMREWLPKPL
jgi:hypothetical protein